MKEKFERIIKSLIAWQKKLISHHSSVQRIKFSTAANFLIKLFIHVHLVLYCRYMDHKKRILSKKLRNHSQPLKLQQNITFT